MGLTPRLWAKVGRAWRSPTLRNLFYLYAVQAANYLFPLVTLPYLARVLGPEGFGKLALAQALSQYLYIVLEYGFSLSATREVAKGRDQPEVLRGILGGVLGARALLFLPAAGAASLALYLFPPLRGEFGLVGGGLLLALGMSLSPIWFFQGMERMGLVAFMEFFVRLLATLGIFFLVRSPGQVAWPLYLQALASFVVGFVGLAWAVSWVGLPWPRFGEAWTWLKRGFSLFFFRAVVSLYTTANVLLVGLFLPPAQVALYAGAEKLTKALIPMWDPFNRLFLPRFSYLMEESPREASRLARWVGGVMLLLGLFAASVLVYAAPLLVRLLLGPGYEGVVPLMRVMAWLLPLIALSNFLGVQWMLSQKMDRPFNAIIFAAGLLNVALALLVVPHHGALGMAWVVVLSEAWVTGAMLGYLWWRGRLPWRPYEG
ncbi:O-antigen transporter [Thermus thermophilus]|uniref:oligosaccharide flippase family protein n=1 Tax=Thermus thermophilus TaxID=274 RepID=UPI001FCB9FD6|nr:oligosaccharide flippase family protein [Thermus thermophilus]BDG18489.1 O-antigen transporter [Thermus thermophilus]